MKTNPKANVRTAFNFFARPRYLRAIPSLVLLTTAMAWGMAPDAVDGDGDGAQKKARVTLSQSAASPSGPAVPGRGGKSANKA